MKMGASEPPEGLGVKAVAAICSGLSWIHGEIWLAVLVRLNAST